jgi:hypothetical protein
MLKYFITLLIFAIPITGSAWGNLSCSSVVIAEKRTQIQKPAIDGIRTLFNDLKARFNTPHVERVVTYEPNEEQSAILEELHRRAVVHGIVEEEEEIEFDVDLSKEPVSYGLTHTNPIINPDATGIRSNHIRQTRQFAHNSEQELLQRMNGLVEDLGEVQSRSEQTNFKSQGEFALDYNGNDGIGQFLAQNALKLKALVREPTTDGLADASAPERFEIRNIGQLAKRFGITLPEKIGYLPMPNRLFRELTGIWTLSYYPQFQGAVHIADALVKGVMSFLFHGHTFGMNGRWALTIYAIGEYGWKAYHTGPPPKQVHTPAFQKVPDHIETRYLHFVKGINDVFMGRRTLGPDEVWYYGTRYENRNSEEDGSEFDFDLVFYNNHGTPRLLVFNRMTE